MNFKHPRIAVVSMAGIFPGARDTRQFIDNILSKREVIGRVPAHRWAAPLEQMVSGAQGMPDKAASIRAGLISDISFHANEFDADGVDLPPDLISCLDPVHHLVLSAGRTALNDCMIPSGLLERTGIILAAIALPTEKASLLAERLLCHPDPGPVHPYQAAGATVVSSPAAILARATGCRGGSFTLDAACASSLFSIKLACEHLLSGRADMMVAGGVSRPDCLYTQVGFTQLSALSPSGRCAPFDVSADGLVVGEGTGIVVLKRLEDALAHQDTIHGVITGWGVSNDIEGNLVAPASEGQIRAMQAAYEMAGWSLSDIQYMECHGSGTAKGDQVELTSIAALARSFDCPDHPLPIGSVKSMVGHLLTAAGAAGFIKTLMAMNRATLPPSLNFSRLPDQSPAHGTGIRVQTHAAPWQPGSPGLPLRAGISAFGFGGINAHLLVETIEPTADDIAPGESSQKQKARDTAAETLSIRENSLQCPPCAVVGLAMAGPGMALPQDEDPTGQSKSPAPGLPGRRWRNPFASEILGDSGRGLFMDSLALDLKDFHIPPNQFPDILAQHLVMLKTARESLLDAGIRPRPVQDEPLRLRMGAALGIDFDFGAADFSLRWHHHAHEDGIRDRLSPPLTFDRTLGALGGIVASRIAREFKLGGPCFTLSAGTVSGFKALETAVLSLGTKETDLFVCGAVDMAGDLCTHLINRALGEFEQDRRPSEGAVALVLKRLDNALEDKDRIHAVIRGIGGASGGRLSVEFPENPAEPNGEERVTALSFDRARAMAAGREDERPGTADLKPFSPQCRHAGAADGLFSIAAACAAASKQTADQAAGLTVVGCRTWEGTAAHVILEAPPQTSAGQSQQRQTKQLRKEAESARAPIAVPVAKPQIPEEIICRLYPPLEPAEARPPEPKTESISSRIPGPEPETAAASATDLFMEIHETTSRAHERFLELSSRNLAEMGRQLALLADVLPEQAAADLCPDPPEVPIHDHPAGSTSLPAIGPEPPQVFLDRAQCLEYAGGKAGTVLGPAFEIIDTYPVRVRLPDEPLMLVDRIMDIQGEMLSLTRGKIVTQHDVLENAWYLDGGKAPVSISIEAGQADLFLCAWLGIDHVVKGRRKYRLLDAKVTFHRPLPLPGETIEYHIEIDRFLRQGEIYLFFFHYKGYIDGLPFISMRDGCAGFFTEAEVENSGGIILKKEETLSVPPESLPEHLGSRPLVPMDQTRLTETQVAALREGDLATAFGPVFKGVVPARPQWLPGGLMTLIHRVLSLEPAGGRFGMGRIVAEADIHPDDWFLTCHFIDDRVMPGTLMYECCAHALRIFVQRMGWISTKAGAHYDVLPANESDLKCRGPVTPETRKARYEIEIKEIGYGPEPFVRADAHMFSDDLRIVLYKDMGMKLAGVTRQDLMAFWRER